MTPTWIGLGQVYGRYLSGGLIAETRNGPCHIACLPLTMLWLWREKKNLSLMSSFAHVDLEVNHVPPCTLRCLMVSVGKKL